MDVRISNFPARSLISSYRSSAWAAVSSRIAKSSSYPDVGVIDDFALRRGHAYATVLINAGTGERVDVLAGRKAEVLEILVTYGEVAQAQALAARAEAAGPGPRRSWLLGTLDFLAGRAAAAEARRREGWQAHDPARTRP